MPLSVHHIEGLYKMAMRVKFCTYSDCGLTNDLNNSTGFKTKSVTHHELSLKKLCWYLINDANVWIIDAIKKVLIYYSQVSQLYVVIKESKW